MTAALPPDAPCPYCGSPVSVRRGDFVYGPGRFTHIHLYVCDAYPGCDSYVGIHDGTDQPKGTLAGPELRPWRSMAHFVFDLLWRNVERAWPAFEERYPDREPTERDVTGWSRSRHYVWLSRRLNIERDETHIAHFGVARAAQVVEVSLIEHLRVGSDMTKLESAVRYRAQRDRIPTAEIGEVISHAKRASKSPHGPPHEYPFGA